MFRFDKLTQKAQEAVQQAQSLAEKHQHQALTPVHLLIALANEREGIVRPVLEKCDVHPDAVVLEAERLIESIPKVSGAGAGAYIAPALNQVFERAFAEAEKVQGRVRLDRAPAAGVSRSRSTSRRASFSTARAPATTPS